MTTELIKIGKIRISDEFIENNKTDEALLQILSSISFKPKYAQGNGKEGRFLVGTAPSFEEVSCKDGDEVRDYYRIEDDGKLIAC